MNKTTVVLIILIIIVLAVIMAWKYLLPQKLPVEGPAEISPAGEEGAEEEITPPAATGNVDDLVDALIKEVSDEESVLRAADDEAAALIDDAQEISDFGQSAEDNEL